MGIIRPSPNYDVSTESTKLQTEQLTHEVLVKIPCRAPSQSLLGLLAYVPVCRALAAVQSKIVPTLKANYLLWPAAHLINFGFVPLELR